MRLKYEIVFYSSSKKGCKKIPISCIKHWVHATCSLRGFISNGVSVILPFSHKIMDTNKDRVRHFWYWFLVLP